MDLCILLSVFLSCISFLSASHCSSYGVGPLVKMPHEEDVLSLDDFDTYVTNRTFSEFYWATPNPAPYYPDLNYHSMFVKYENGTYEEQSFGETRGDNSSCYTIEFPLVPYGNSGKALFFSEDFGIVIAGTADDVPLTSILKDLCQATGIKFGSESFRWFLTYGEAKLCAADNIP